MKRASEAISGSMRAGMEIAVRLAAVLLGWIATCLPAPAADTAAINVYAAASMQVALDNVAAEYARASGVRIVGVYGSSGALARQIERGAPADLFISANVEWMDYLQARGALAPGTRRNVAGNQLVVVHSPCTAKPSGNSFAEVLMANPDGRIAMGNPDSVPAGSYARQALIRLDVWEFVRPRAVQSENVRVALAWTARCEVDLGLVYRSDAVAGKPLGIGIAAMFPSDSHDQITYPIAVMAGRHSATVARFAEYLAGDDALAVFEAFGFDRAGGRSAAPVGDR